MRIGYCVISRQFYKRNEAKPQSHWHEHERGKRQDEKDDDMRPVRELVREYHTDQRWC